MSDRPQSEFELPEDDLLIVVKRKNGSSFEITTSELQLLAEQYISSKDDYMDLLRAIQVKLREIYSISLTLPQVEWLYLKKKEIEESLKKNGQEESTDSNTMDSLVDSSTSTPVDQWVDETANISSNSSNPT